jgi:hypothetical protein
MLAIKDAILMVKTDKEEVFGEVLFSKNIELFSLPNLIFRA